jgi:formate dehydrogenase maturation protein FdhE
MSKQQLADLEAETAALPPNEVSDEVMYMAFQIRFWKQKAWRAEQQRDREILARKEVEAKLDRFKGLTEEHLEEMLSSLKKQELSKVKAEASKIIGVSPWVKYTKDEELIEGLDAKIKFWTDLLNYYQKEWKDEDY